MKANLKYWTAVLREAERELDAVTCKSELDAVARKLMQAKRELKRLGDRPAAKDAGRAGPNRAGRALPA